MDIEEARIEHLILLQAVVDRMAKNSFAVKAGTLAFGAALLALSFGIHSWLMYLVTLPVLALWALDSYYIRLERLFRRLYDKARTGPAPEFGAQDYFSMNVDRKAAGVGTVLGTMFSSTLLIFYLPLLLVTIAAVFVISIL